MVDIIIDFFIKIYKAVGIHQIKKLYALLPIYI
jgi:hypothetical protein